MTYSELAELFKREGGDAQVCFSVISQNQILFGNNDTKKDIISFKNDEPIKWVKDLQEEPNKVKFNVGDTIKNKDGYEVTIESVGDDCYFVDKAQACIKFSTQDQWELVEEPVSEELEEAAKNYALNNTPWDDCKKEIQEAFVAGAWWKEHHQLTVDDIMKLDALLISMWQSKSLNKYEEVLKKFKAQKEEEEV